MFNNQPCTGQQKYPILSFCRKDFLHVVRAIANNGVLDATKLIQTVSLEDIASNIALANAACQHVELKELGTYPLVFEGKEDAEKIAYYQRVGLAPQYVEEGHKWLQGFLPIPAPNDHSAYSMDGQCEWVVSGGTLFIGVTEGFVGLLANKSNLRIFLTNCLEQCQTQMQGPALTASPLYRRFIFSNVNV